MSDDSPFVRVAVAAFPRSSGPAITEAARIVAPMVDADYRLSTVKAVVQGRLIAIPKRIHFIGDIDDITALSTFSLPIACLQTRSTDGYVRQASLRKILPTSEPWLIPFIVLLAGEYVVEIIEDIVASLSQLDASEYANFVRENRPLMAHLRAKAASYWNCYYRDVYDKRSYPGLMFLHQLECWAM